MSDVQVTKKVRGRGKNKRQWKSYEDDALVQSPLKISRDPQFTSVLGFKNGYLEKLESMLNEKLPDSKFTLYPHIWSRLKTLRGKYTCLTELLGRTGATWDDEKKQLVIDKDTYVQYLKDFKMGWCLGGPWTTLLVLFRMIGVFQLQKL